MKAEFTPMEAGYVIIAIEGQEKTVQDAVYDITMRAGNNLLSSVDYSDVFDADDGIKRATFLMRITETTCHE